MRVTSGGTASTVPLRYLADKSAQAISNIKFDKVVVWDGGHGGADGKGSATSNFLQNLAHTLPPMLQVMKDVGGVQFPETIAKLMPDAPKAPPAPPSGGRRAPSCAL